MILRPDNLPSLSVLRCFEAAAKHASFTHAAEDLGLTQSVVSRQVKELEAHLGTALFRREGRGIRLTSAGEAFAHELAGDLYRLRRTVQNAAAAGSGPPVMTIAAPPTFAARWLVPRLQGFRAQQGDLELIVFSRGEPFDLDAEKVDAAVHFGGWDWPGARLTPLCPENLKVVASPDLLGGKGDWRASDILELPLLHLTARPRLWSDFALHAGDEAPLRYGCHFDQFNLLIAAAIAGMGVAILPTYLVEQELSGGTLRAIADVPDTNNKSYFVATPTGVQNETTTAFVKWLRNQVANRL